MNSNVATQSERETREEHRSGGRWAALLDPAPGTPRWGWAETLALLLWCAVAGVAVAQHTPWADEMQAWLLAGGVSWTTLFTHSLHYEGTGGLWHAFLKALQAAGVSFTGMQWIVAGIEGAAMAVLLAFAPFPRIVRLLLPFTFFLLYQDGVVARSYCLFAVFAFPAAVLLRSTRPRPLLLAVLLGLMANISVHAAIASGGFAIAALFQWRRRLMASVPAVLVLLLLWAGAIATMSPARDIDFSAGVNLQRAVAKVERQAGIDRNPPPSLIGQRMANLEPAPVPVHVRHGFARLWNKLSRGLAVVTYPLSASRLLALLLVGCVAAQALLQRRPAPLSKDVSARDTGSLGPIGLAPYGLMVGVFTFLYLSPRHVGMVLTGFVVSAWLSWPGRTQTVGRRLLLARATALLLLLLCAEQIAWSTHAIVSEHRLPYGPGKMTAEYLKSQGVSAAAPQGGHTPQLAGFYYGSIDPLLYFDRNLYANQPAHRYWFWSTTMRSYRTAQQVLAGHPEFIVIGGFDSGPDGEIPRDWEPVTPPVEGVVLNDSYAVAQFFERNGYRPARVFCGHSWMRATYAELLCDTVLEPRSSPAR